MSGPVSPPLATTESGTSTIVRPTNTLEFNGADFTVTGSGSKATISLDSTGTGAALTATQVGFGDASNLLTGDSTFIFDATNKRAGLHTAAPKVPMTIVTQASRAGTTELGGLGVVASNDTSVLEGVQIFATGTDNNIVSTVFFVESENSGVYNYGWRIEGDGANNVLAIHAHDNSATGIKGFEMARTTGSVRINPDSNATSDFSVLGDTTTLLFVDVSQDNIGVGTSPPASHGGTTVRMTVQGDDDDIALMLQNAGSDADDGPQMTFYRNSSSPAADDLLGRIRFDGEDSGGNIHTYFRMTNAIKDPTDASEDGRFIFEGRVGGALNEIMRFEANDVIFNNDSLAGVDVQIKGDNDTIFFSDASQDNLGIGTSSPSSDVERVHVKGTGGSDPMVRIESTDDDANAGPIIEMYRNSATPADNDLIGKLEFSANDAGGSKHVLASIKTVLRDEAAGGEDGTVVFEAAQFGSDAVEFLRYGLDPAQSNRQVVVNNSNKNYISFLVKGQAAAIISTDPSGNNFNVNPFGNAAVDMIVSGDTETNLLRTDASEDNIGIACTPDSGALLHIKDDGNKTSTVLVESTDNDTAVGPVVTIRRNNADGAATDGDNLGQIQFVGLDDIGGLETYAKIRATAADTHSVNAEGALEITNLYDGTTINSLRIGPINDGGSANNAVDVNPDSVASCDFRVRGDSVSNMFYCDVSTDKIGIHTFPRSGGSALQVDGAAEFLSFFGTKGAATVALSEEEGYNSFITLTYDAGTQAITLPTAVNGMKITLARQQATNAPTVVAATGEKINGTAAPSTLTMGAQYSVMVLHGITGTGWIAYEPAVAS